MTYILSFYVIAIIVVAYFRSNRKASDEMISYKHEGNFGFFTRSFKRADNKKVKREILPGPISMSLKEMNLLYEKQIAENGNIIYRFPIKTIHMNTDVVIVESQRENSIKMMIRNPILIPELMRNPIFEFIGIINYSYEYGDFEMDHRDGEIRLRSSLILHDRRKISTETITNWLNDLFGMMDTTFPGFIAVAFGNAIPSEMWDKIQNAPDPKLN